jgi:hypothetical protein
MAYCSPAMGVAILIGDLEEGSNRDLCNDDPPGLMFQR